MTWNLGFCPDNTTTFEILFTLWGFFCTNLLTLTSHETFNRCPTYTEFIVSCLNPDLMCNGANKNEGAATSAEISGFVLQNAVIEFYSNKITSACRLFPLLWGCFYIFYLYCFYTFLKWLFYVLYSLTASIAQMEKYGNPLVAKIISVNPTQP